MTTRILVVDDFEQWRLLVRSILENVPGLRVVGEASDGVEAVKEAATLLPDIVLLDVGMPRLNGIEAAERIRHASPESKIIFLTQDSDSEVKRAALATGALAYLSKSRANYELRATIETAMLTFQTAGAKLSVPESSSLLQNWRTCLSG